MRPFPITSPPPGGNTDALVQWCVQQIAAISRASNFPFKSQFATTTIQGQLQAFNASGVALAAANPAGAFFNRSYFGNPANGDVQRFNRVKIGIAALSSSDIPQSTPDWLESLNQGFSSQGQLTVISALGTLGIVGAARSSDFPTWDGTGNHTGGAQGGTFFGYNDDFTGGAPIAVGVNAVGIRKASVSATVTITIASPAVITWTNHQLPIGAAVVFSTSGSLPTGITAGTTYFIISAGFTANSFQISATQGGTAINTSGTQSGTQTGTAGVAGVTLGQQSDMNNAGSVVDITPFGGVVGGTTFAHLFTAGAFGPLATANISVGTIYGANASPKMRKGSIFLNGGLDASVGAGGNGVAIEFARNMSLRWLNSGGGTDGEFWVNATGLIINNAVQLQLAPAANTSIDGLILFDGTAASAGNQQFSPRIRLTGQGWKTNATAASQTVDFIMENQPQQGAANPTGALTWSSQINGGGYTSNMILYSTGELALNTYNFLLPSAAGVATPYNQILDTASNGALILGGGGSSPDKTNYYRNTTHIFSDIAGANYSHIFNSGGVWLLSGASLPAGGPATVTIRMFSGLGIMAGSGAPTASAPQGTIYLRSDGSSGTTRAYINTNGSTTWTAINTVA